MNTHRKTMFIALALLATSACLYGARGGGEKWFEWDGERCAALEGVTRNWYSLGYEGSKLHGFGGSKRFYAYCFAFRGKGGQTLAITVESEAFQPEIILVKRGEDGAVAQDQGNSVAQFEVTLPKNGDYALVVTSVRPYGTGRFDVSYQVE